jgi:hypothetical protein
MHWTTRSIFDEAVTECCANSAGSAGTHPCLSQDAGVFCQHCLHTDTKYSHSVHARHLLLTIRSSTHKHLA